MSEEFTTLFVQVKYILNIAGRCYRVTENNSVELLTPWHFLEGFALPMIPEEETVPVARNKH